MSDELLKSNPTPITVEGWEIKNDETRRALRSIRLANTLMHGMAFDVSTLSTVTSNEKDEGKIGIAVFVNAPIEDRDHNSQSLQAEPIKLQMGKGAASVIVKALLEQGAMTEEEVKLFFEDLEDRRKKGLKFW